MSEATTVLDQVADGDLLAERIALAERFQFFKDLPNVTLGLDVEAGTRRAIGFPCLVIMNSSPLLTRSRS